MLRTALVLVATVLSILSLVGTVQVPLDSSHGWPDASYAIRGEDQDNLAEWNLDQPVDPNDTGHLVFETVHSLLQRWPNTRMRNGHNIVPGVIPKGTLLYHVKEDDELPQGPWWLATEPEHSDLFCINFFLRGLDESCRLFTFATTRPLKIVYFDGSSAAKIPNGTADTQELLAWGTTRGGAFEMEKPMVRDLCEWGRDFGLDGFVRMEMDFEIVICDSTTGLSPVSSVSLPMRGTYTLDIIEHVTYEVIEAGSWHNRFPGETRVQLDLAGLVSFYDTQLVPSLVPIRVGQERWDHRVQHTSSGDLLAVKSRLEAALAGPPNLSGETDWRTLIQVVVDRFAGRLELMRHLLTSSSSSSAADSSNLLDLAKRAQTQLRAMLRPYIPFYVKPVDLSDKADLAWVTPVYKYCATTHTSFLVPKSESMTDSERLILRAVRGTTKEICRVVTSMWAAGVYASLDGSLNANPSPDIAEAMRVWNAWGDDLDRLMKWLDWSVWATCKPQCGPEELCYLPTWPVGFEWNRPWLYSEAPDRLDVVSDDLVVEVRNPRWTVGPEERARPEPRCISRFAPPE